MSTLELFERILQLKIELERVKPLYAELDAHVMDLVARGERTYLRDGVVYEIVDNFEGTNTVFRPAGVKRFEFCAVKEPKARKKSA